MDIDVELAAYEKGLGKLYQNLPKYVHGGDASGLCQVFVGTFFVFSNSVEKLCVSWALSLVECVAVWALKLPVPHTDVLKPTSRKVFLRNY